MIKTELSKQRFSASTRINGAAHSYSLRIEHYDPTETDDTVKYTSYQVNLIFNAKQNHLLNRNIKRGILGPVPELTFVKGTGYPVYKPSIADPGSEDGDSTSITSLIIPTTRRIFPELIAHEVMSVQPMTPPSGMAFNLRQKYDTPKYVKPKVQFEQFPIEDLKSSYIALLCFLDDTTKNKALSEAWSLTKISEYIQLYVLGADLYN